MGRFALALAALWAGPVLAAGVSGRVTLEGHAGPLAPGTIAVFVTGFTQPPPPESEHIAQRNKTFLPALRVIVAGQSIAFTNDDVVLHNVFSTSEARPFDLGKPGPNQTREVKFPRPGLVDVYCNMHESMAATVLVLPNRAHAFADADGRFKLSGVPAGRYVVHAYGRDFEPASVEVSVPAENASVSTPPLELHPRAFKAGHLDKYGRPYRVHAGYEP